MINYLKIIFFIVCLFPGLSYGAASIPASSCAAGHIRTAVDACYADGECRTVTIPAGTCEWDTDECESSTACVDVDYNEFTHDITIQGDSNTTTILKRTNAGGDFGSFFRFDGNVYPNSVYKVTIKDMQFADTATTLGNVVAIWADDIAWLQVQNCIFDYGEWHTVVGGKRIQGGLIEGNIFRRTFSVYTSDYGISPSSDYGSAGTGDYAGYANRPSCNTCDAGACEAEWEAWWLNDNYHGGPGYGFEDEWDPSDTTKAIFIENNTFIWKGSTMQGNWGSNRGVVWRYNTMENEDGNNGGFKPGAWYWLIYNNEIENTGGTPPNSEAIYARSDGLIFNNEFTGYAYGGKFYSVCAYSDHLFSEPTVQMNELYIWGNTYVNATCDGTPSDCWTLDTAYLDVYENTDYFYREPTTGDRLDGYSLPTCPHPLSGKGGSCDSNIKGVAGYNVEAAEGPAYSGVSAQ